MKNIHVHFIIKVLLILLFLLIVACGWIAYIYQSPSYESSIYYTMPSYFWIIFFSIFLVLLIMNFYLKESRDYLIYTIIMIFLICSLILSLSIIRGYFAYAIFNDPAYHWGNLDYIVLNGNIPDPLFYPIIHILGSIVYLLIGDQLSQLLFVFILNIVFLIIQYLIFLGLFKDFKTRIIGIFFVSTLTLGISLYFTPTTLLVGVFPLMVYLIYKGCTKRIFIIPLIIIGIISPFIHPICMLIYITIFSSFLIYSLVEYFQYKSEKKLSLMEIYRNRSFNIILIPFFIGFVLNLYWMLQFYFGGLTIRGIYDSIILQTLSPSSEQIFNKLNYASEYGYNLIELFLKYYGNIAIIFMLFIITILWIIFFKSNLSKIEKMNITFFSIMIVTILMFVGTLLFTHLPFGPFRLLQYTYFLIVIIIALTFGKSRDLYGVSQYSPILNFIFVVSLFLLFFNSIFSLYPSVYLHLMNEQNTETDIKGFLFFHEYRFDSYHIVGITTAPGRLQEYLSFHRDLPEYFWGSGEPPPHFGYNDGFELGRFYDTPMYLIITNRDIIRYSEIVPEMASKKQQKGDFDKLEYDKTINAIYSNGFFYQKIIM